MSPQDTPDLTKSLTDPLVITEDEDGDDDETPTPDRMDSSNIKDICKREGTRVQMDALPHIHSGYRIGAVHL